MYKNEVFGVPGNQDTHKSVKAYAAFAARESMLDRVGGGEGQLDIIRLYAKVEARVPLTPLGVV